MLTIASAAHAIDAVSPTTDPGTGFPIWYRDSPGIQIEPCLAVGDANCLAPLGIPNPANPLAVPGNFPDEFFYYSADATVGPFTWFVALEGAFAGGPPAVNDQMVFYRLQIDGAGLQAGATYTISHPYGESVVTANALGVVLRYREEVVPAPLAFGGVFASPLTSLLVSTGIRAIFQPNPTRPA